MTVTGTGNPIQSGTLDLDVAGAATARWTDGDGRRYSFGALTPDGARMISNAVPPDNRIRGLSGTMPSRMWDTSTGDEIPAPSFTDVVSYAVTPQFAPDATALAFSWFSSGGADNGRVLAVMSYDGTSSPPLFGAPRRVVTVTDTSHIAGWPSFTPDGLAVVYEESTAFDTSLMGGVGNPNRPVSSDLRLVDLSSCDGSAEACAVSTLDVLNGYASGAFYPPYGEAEEAHSNYEPTVLPIAIGGYYWVVFTSRRCYGNTLAPGGTVAGGDDRWGYQASDGGEHPSVRKKLWIAAIDITGGPGTDRSHPPFYLPGQELESGNMRGFAALDPCKPDGDSCASAAECCGGFCRATEPEGGGEPELALRATAAGVLRGARSVHDGRGLLWRVDGHALHQQSLRPNADLMARLDRHVPAVLLFEVVLALSGCGRVDFDHLDTGSGYRPDAGDADARRDGDVDADVGPDPDASPADASEPDASEPDASEPDGAMMDASGPDTGAMDAGATDSAMPDSGSSGCVPGSVPFTTDDVFVLPAGCTTFTVRAEGGGGAGSGGNSRTNAVGAPGGAGGLAIKSFAGQVPGTSFDIVIGRGGTCESRSSTAGGYLGGGGGRASGSGDGQDGGGTGPGGVGAPASGTGSQPGGDGGHGYWGGGGGGGGGDVIVGNSAGGATTFRLGAADLVIAGGGGASGAGDQDGDRAGAGGAACDGYNGADGATGAGSRSGAGGGGGACYCEGGCDVTPTSGGGLAGMGSSRSSCSAIHQGADGRVVVSYP